MYRKPRRATNDLRILPPSGAVTGIKNTSKHFQPDFQLLFLPRKKQHSPSDHGVLANNPLRRGAVAYVCIMKSGTKRERTVNVGVFLTLFLLKSLTRR